MERKIGETFEYQGKTYKVAEFDDCRNCAFGCVGGYPYCLPYNEDTAKLIGTTDDWKGGKQ